MMNIKLSERLMSIADMTGGVESAADIGCDHGRLSVYLAQQGIKVIAVDISPRSLQKAELLKKRRGVSDMIDCRLGDGLQVIMPGEVQAIMISGIGQRNISEILKNGNVVAKSAEFIVLQPMDGALLLRRELCSQGYLIKRESLVKEGHRLHAVIQAVPTDIKVNLNVVDLALGPRLLKANDKYMHEYLMQQQMIYKSIAEGLMRAETKPSNELNEIIKINNAIGDMLYGVKGN